LQIPCLHKEKEHDKKGKNESENKFDGNAYIARLFCNCFAHKKNKFHCNVDEDNEKSGNAKSQNKGTNN
jgi:hypothetical protein